MISVNILSILVMCWKQKQGTQTIFLQGHVNKFPMSGALEPENVGANSNSLINYITLGQDFNALKVSIFFPPSKILIAVFIP